MKRVTVNITEAELAELHRLSDLSDIPWSELLRRALDQYLNKPDIRARIADKDADQAAVWGETLKAEEENLLG